MLPEVVAGSIIKGLAVLIKKGWIDDERHQQAPVSIRRFLDVRDTAVMRRERRGGKITPTGKAGGFKSELT